mmetsp:Transcript_108159/g.304636  ORF Transcript_108159/g.304636 Transcript_108159/m.304636 type:complete len:447 (+) Transcript_108159:59-1399(+)
MAAVPPLHFAVFAGDGLTDARAIRKSVPANPPPDSALAWTPDDVSSTASSSSSCGSPRRSGWAVDRDVVLPADCCAWDYPLSVAQKRERLLVMLEIDRAAREREFQSTEHHASCSSKQAAPPCSSGGALLEEHTRLQRKVDALVSENQRLRGRLTRLVVRMRREKQQQNSLPQSQQHLQQQAQQHPEQELAQQPQPQQGFQQEQPYQSQPQRQSQQSLQQKPQEQQFQRRLSHAPLAAFCDVPPLQAVALKDREDDVCKAGPTTMAEGTLDAEAAAAPSQQSLGSICRTPRFLLAGLVTPRPAQTPRAATARTPLRGTVVAVSWAQGHGVPWMGFMSRVSGLLCVYGERDSAEHEGCSFSLRRGEYIRSISGVCGPRPLLASSMRICTSEEQELVAGTADGADTEVNACCFFFEAAPGHEITGLKLDDAGAVLGVRQAPLVPPRAP